MTIRTTYVDGTARSLRNFFMDLCDDLEEQETQLAEIERLQDIEDQHLGAEDVKEELREMVTILDGKVTELEKTIEEKDTLIKDLKKQLKDLQRVNNDLVQLTELKTPKEATETKPKKKVIKKKKRI